MTYPTPLVSIAMATYNGAKYLDLQLQSILNQSYPKLEIIITDDASTDETPDMLDSFKNLYGNIRVIRNEINRGITPSFEQSIKNCKGDYIAISDQDDIWETDKIRTLLNAIKNEDLIYSDSELIDKNGDSMHKLISSLANLGSFRSGAPFLMGLCLPGHSMLMQGDFARYILPIPRIMMYDRWISFCAGANNGIKYLDQPLVKYRQHETNYFGVGVVRNNKKRTTKKEKYHIKFLELKACENAPIRDVETKKILQQMLGLYNRKLSLTRSLFFFKYRHSLLSIKKKNNLLKLLYCLKMFFKPNY